jgi:hypothetical protein
VTSEDRIIRGKNAEQLLSNPLLGEAFIALEQDIVDTWKRSAGVTADVREDLFRQLSVLSTVKDKLESFVNDGKISQNRVNLKTL